MGSAVDVADRHPNGLATSLNVQLARRDSSFGGELFPKVVESGSGLVFADFFKNERDGGHEGIVVLTIGGSS